MNNAEFKDKVRIDAFFYAVYAALIPFEDVMNFGFGTIQKYVGLFVIAMMWIMILIEKKSNIYIKLPRNFIIFFFLAAWSIATLIWGVKGSMFPQTLINLTLLFTTCCLRGFNAKETKLVLYAILISGLAVTVWMLRNPDMFVGIRGTIVTKAGEADQNTIGVSCALSACVSLWFFFIEKKMTKKGCYFALYLFLLIGLIITGSRTGLMALLSGTLYEVIAASKKKKALYSVGIKVITIVLIAIMAINYAIEIGVINADVLERFTMSEVKETNGAGRLVIWQGYIEALNLSPLNAVFGFGYGSSPHVLSQYVGRTNSTHNSYLGFLVTTGIIGLTMLILILYQSWKTAKSKNADVLLALLLAGMVASMSIDFFDKKMFWNVLTLIWASVFHLDAEETR